jgi:hypothetical protein
MSHSFAMKMINSSLKFMQVLLLERIFYIRPIHFMSKAFILNFQLRNSN